MDCLGVEEFDAEEAEKNRIKYSINGKGEYAKKNLATELIRLFVEQNSDMSASDVIRKWDSLGKFVPHFVENQAEYDARTDKKEKRTNVVLCAGEKIYVSNRKWGGKTNAVDDLINSIPKDWNLDVQKIQ